MFAPDRATARRVAQKGSRPMAKAKKTSKPAAAEVSRDAQATLPHTFASVRNEFALPLANLDPNPNQPRKNYDPIAMARLQAQLSSEGQLQPIWVRPSTTTPGRFILVDGSRRELAAKLLGWTTINAVIDDGAETPARAALHALIGNDGEPLNPIERAEAYALLIREHGYTHAELGGLLSKEREDVTSTLRLLQLAPGARAFVAGGQLGTRHARALLRLPDGMQDAAAAHVVSTGLSAAKTERYVAKLLEAAVTAGVGDEESNGSSSAQATPGVGAMADHADALAAALRAALGAESVALQASGTNGLRVVFTFATLDALASALLADVVSTPAGEEA